MMHVALLLKELSASTNTPVFVSGTEQPYEDVLSSNSSLCRVTRISHSTLSSPPKHVNQNLCWLQLNGLSEVWKVWWSILFAKTLIPFRLVGPEWRNWSKSCGVWRRKIIFLLFCLFLLIVVVHCFCCYFWYPTRLPEIFEGKCP